METFYYKLRKMFLSTDDDIYDGLNEAETSCFIPNGWIPCPPRLSESWMGKQTLWYECNGKLVLRDLKQGCIVLQPLCNPSSPMGKNLYYVSVSMF